MSKCGQNNLRICPFLKMQPADMHQRHMERSKTSGRSDYNIDTLKKRSNAYAELTMSVTEFCQKKDKLKAVNANEGVEEVLNVV